MLDSFYKFRGCINNKTARITNNYLNQVLHSYSFLHISEIDFKNENQKLFQSLKESNQIIINIGEEDNSNERYFLLGLKNNIIFIEQSSLSLIQQFFHDESGVNICFLSNDIKNIFDRAITIKYQEIKVDKIFSCEITSFNSQFEIISRGMSSICKIWSVIQPCISGFLIKQSYSKLSKNRFKDFNSKQNQNLTKKEIDEFIELRVLGIGSVSNVALFYHIEKEELFAIKKLINAETEKEKLFDRETTNYNNMKHPLLPNFYGILKPENYLIIEFINGMTLDNIKEMKLELNDKLKIIFEMMIIIGFIHSNHLIYRDLKPTNIIIDDNKTAILIDFDRMIKIDSISNKDDVTADFQSVFHAPEVSCSYECDIYSLGKMIYYIMKEEEPPRDSNELEKVFENEDIQKIYKMCVNADPKKRQSISKLILDFYFTFSSQIEVENVLEIFEKYLNNLYDSNILNVIRKFNDVPNDPKMQALLALLYVEGEIVEKDMDKAIHYLELATEQKYKKAPFMLASYYFYPEYGRLDYKKAMHYLIISADLNYVEAQLQIAGFYEEGKYLERDVVKAVHYYTMAAENNSAKAQYELGAIYQVGRYVPQNISKAIHYYTLSAEQHYPKALVNLASIYYKGLYVSRDINKAISYFSDAAKQNDARAFVNLGNIYFDGIYVKQDIDKGLYYYAQAVNLNDSEGQFFFGDLYSDGIYVKEDMNKSIHYYTLAANQNHDRAQFNLGLLYYEGKQIPKNINKAIHYLTLSANNNAVRAQLLLGSIYIENKDVPRDVKKSLHFFNMAANQNDPQAHYTLGTIYHEGKYVQPDIYKAVKYLTFSANQNDRRAQTYLGEIYFDEHSPLRDYDKAIHYFQLAANNGEPTAQFLLGVYYEKGFYFKQDINKAIHYYLLAANNNYSEAMYYLAILFDEGKYVPHDLNKAIFYYTLAANYDHPKAQIILGLTYYKGIYVSKDIQKGLDLIKRSAYNRDTLARFVLGFLYHEGKYIQRNINEAIHFYKEGSSLNYQFAKNNLGIIHKNGFYEKIQKNIGLAIEYFNEAINQKSDPVSMYNLANLYLYEGPNNDSIDNSIELLIKSAEKGFIPSRELLCLALIKKHGYNLDNIQNELQNKNGKNISIIICQMIQKERLNIQSIFDERYKYFKNICFLYDFNLKPVLSNSLFNNMFSIPEKNQKKDINEIFYEGFEIEV